MRPGSWGPSVERCWKWMRARTGQIKEKKVRKLRTREALAREMNINLRHESESWTCISMWVLVFPPVNNYRRFLIHKLVEEQFPTLTTFSIGGGESRRPVICFRTDYVEPPAAKKKAPEEKPKESKTPEPSLPQPKRERRSYAMPSISIYRPPAARRQEEQKIVESGQEPGQEGVDHGVNGKLGCKCLSELDDTDKKITPSGISMFRSAISSIRTQNQTPKCKIGDGDKKSSQVRQRRPDMKVYVPKARRIMDEQQQKPPKDPPRQNGGAKVKREDSEKVESEDGTVRESNSDCTKEEFKDKDKPVVRTVKKEEPDPKPESVHHVSPSSLWIEAQNDVDEGGRESSQKASDPESTSPVKDPGERICDKKEKFHLNPEECDWESMFDDSGECLDPSLMEQLSSAVGSVTIEKPKSNYDTFKTKALDLVGEEFPHVIEIYNFPPEFRHQDIVAVFSQFKNAGFEIKWVDDTHALGIFSNSQIVSEVLTFHHPFVKTRLLKDGTMLSKAKARRSAEQLLPYKPRPDTCPALARRLVTGALGVRLPTSREEREAERKILSEAREKKRLEARQREEAWEGNFH